VAYTGGLSRPLIASADALGNLSPETLHEFHAANFTAPRMVLAASGVEHQELLSLAEPLLSSFKNTGAAKPPPSKYVGGDFRWGLMAAPKTTRVLPVLVCCNTSAKLTLQCLSVSRTICCICPIHWCHLLPCRALLLQNMVVLMAKHDLWLTVWPSSARNQCYVAAICRCMPLSAL
jgi:Peptidase M16 inactive domain